MSDDAKTVSDLPVKGQKPPKSADQKAASLPVKDADTVKGGAVAKGSIGNRNHNQTLRARRASHS